MKTMITLRDSDLKAQYAEQAWRLRKNESELLREALQKFLPEIKKRKLEKPKFQ